MDTPQFLHLSVINEKGIHARIAAKIVRIAEDHQIDATLSHNDMTVPLNSIMGLLLLSARKGSVVTISSASPKASTLFKDIESLFNNKFYEE